MAYQHIELTVQSGLYHQLVLNRPDVHNAFHDEMLVEMKDALRSASLDSESRFLVIKGKGKSFCTGADLNWMKSMMGQGMEENSRDAAKLSDFFLALDEYPKPILGVVQGLALGGGAGLVACCDHVICADSATLGFSEVKLGLVPAVISPYVLRKIGYSNAVSLFTSGARFGAGKAMGIGLVHQVVADNKLEECESFAIREYLSCGPVAMVEAKKLVRRVDLPSAQAMEAIRSHCVEKIAELRVKPEGQEGMNAVLQKRHPIWRRNLP